MSLSTSSFCYSYSLVAYCHEITRKSATKLKCLAQFESHSSWGVFISTLTLVIPASIILEETKGQIVNQNLWSCILLASLKSNDAFNSKSMELDQKLKHSKVASSTENESKTNKNRPVSEVTGRRRKNSLVSQGIYNNETEDIIMERNEFDGDKNGSATKPASSSVHRKEVGKVRPMRILSTSKQKSSEEDDFSDKLKTVMRDFMEEQSPQEDQNDLSIILEKSKIDSQESMMINPTVIDPTKDFYNTTGRPVSPVLLPGKLDTISDDPIEEDNKIQNTKDQDSSEIKSVSYLPSKTSRNSSTGSSERVKVIIRCRPLSEKERLDGHECIVQLHSDRNEVEVRRPKSLSTSAMSASSDLQDRKVFAFDSIYDSRSSQMELYNDAFRPLVDSVLEGFNGTIFAYGQTGTGKTYTMEGNRVKESEQGVIPNAFRHIFSHVAENSNKQYLIRASYLEIYQEEIRDLLSKERKQHRELRESPSSGVYVKDLSTYLCSNFSEINDLMTRGNKNRAVGATNMNEHSSRSHAIFMITIEMSEKWSDGRNHFKVGKLNLVDLAGSERQGKTGAAGERFKEATKINLSLSALGNVIAALVDGKSTHIPYRDSKLTRLLQDSLGGNSRTIMVATIGPASFNWDETITTLRYASRAKNIKNKPKVNEDPKDALLRQYQEEIERLRVELERKKAKQTLMLQQSQSDSLDRKTRPKSRSHTASSTNSDSSSHSHTDLQRQVEEQRLRELTTLLEPYGLDPTTEPRIIMEKLAERRKELLQDNLTMKVEKDTLLKKLDETESLVRNTEEECSKLSERIGWLESKVLTGGKDLVDHTNEQQKLLQAKQQELAEEMERYEEMKKKMLEEELTIEELKVNAEAFEAELQAKIKKYKKLTHKFQATKNDLEGIHEDHSNNMRELETVLMELKKEFSLKKMIIDNFIPSPSRKLIERRMLWDEDHQLYKLAPLDSSNAIQRPQIDRSTKLPLFNISETGGVHMVPNVHSTNENILQLHPEMPKMRTKNYVPPNTDPYITSLVRRAIDDVEREIVIDCCRISKKRTTTAKIPHSMDYFKMGENIIRRVKSARPVLRAGEAQPLQFRDFAIVSPSESAHVSNILKTCTPLDTLSPFSPSQNISSINAHAVSLSPPPHFIRSKGLTQDKNVFEFQQASHLFKS